ncbi:MAG: alanine--glyoxylate aminotransferase family protein [Gemmatimonadetes bacterium]|nr:alanine--glyoxylate aminotransferase family protein [Gemmatimonadota bacterium]
MTDTDQSEFGRFFLPGPTEVRPEVLRAMTRPMIGHRGAEMSALLREVDGPLRAVFRTTRPVYVASSSATGLMEGAIRNGVRRRALSLVNGAFSARFRDLVPDCGREVETYEVPWGEAHDPGELLRHLRAGGFDAVTVVHSDTSTGVLNPLRDLAEAVRAAERETGEEILLLVDGVTSVGGALVEMDEWGLDFLLTGSQKALALPPGLAFGAASPRMLRRAESIPARGQYFDLVEFEAQWAKHQTPNTPALSLIYALVEQMRRIREEGVEARVARHREMAERCWEWVETEGARRGLSVLAPEGLRSPTHTAIVLPEHLKGPRVTAALGERGWTIAAGYGKLKDSTIRIGHMGDHTRAELDALLVELEEVLG